MGNLEKFFEAFDKSPFFHNLKENVINSYKTIAENFFSLFSVLNCLLIFTFIVILISFSFTLIGNDSYWKTIADSIVNLISSGSEQRDYEKVLSYGITVSTVAVALLPTVSLVLEKRKCKKKVNISTPIEKKSVGIDEGPDLKVMLEYYKVADKVIVHSGGFSWLPKNEELRTLILKLSKEKKISLVSYKAEEDVKSQVAQKDLFDELKEHFIFNSGKTGAKCSLVKIRSESVFLYKDVNLQEKKGYVCIVSGKGEGHSLLKTIEQLFNDYDPENRWYLQRKK